MSRDSVHDALFRSSMWVDQLEKGNLSALIFGDDLGSVGSPIHCASEKPLYLALLLLFNVDIRGEQAWNDIKQEDPMFPLNIEFFDSLKEWRWYDEEKSQILIKESNIILSIPDYQLGRLDFHLKYLEGHQLGRNLKPILPNRSDVMRGPTQAVSLKQDKQVTKAELHLLQAHWMFAAIVNGEKVVRQYLSYP
ncbi:hypothetical protein BGZ63DRAFT_397698 [Mariannaea sp. PMI_226]|nr:hypothetical protein BGZ63DRAFT_397698 [Mariannaea sp. PMI_226]